MIEFDPILLHEWLRRSAGRVPGKEALICGDERWTYRKLDAYSDCFAEMLLELGICRQDRVVICAGNCAETVISLYGTLKAGGIFVVLDGNTRSRRLGQVIGNAAAKVLVASTDQAAVVRDAVAKLNADLRIVWVGASTAFGGYAGVPNITWESLFSPLSDADHGACRPVTNRLHRCLDVDLACLIYTSGTTGSPKGVMCSHRGMISAARSIIQYLDNRPEDVILNVLPLSFSYGIYQVLMSSMFGGTVVLENSFLYPHLVLKRIAEERVTGFPLVPSLAAMMLRMDGTSEYDFHTLRDVKRFSGTARVVWSRSWSPSTLNSLRACRRLPTVRSIVASCKPLRDNDGRKDAKGCRVGCTEDRLCHGVGEDRGHLTAVRPRETEAAWGGGRPVWWNR